jgi:hypothetical protein
MPHMNSSIYISISKDWKYYTTYFIIEITTDAGFLLDHRKPEYHHIQQKTKINWILHLYLIMMSVSILIDIK